MTSKTTVVVTPDMDTHRRWVDERIQQHAQTRRLRRNKRGVK